MLFLLKYIRYIILTVAVLLAVLLFTLTVNQFTNLTAAYVELGQNYAIIALGLIYLSLIITPIYFAFPNLPLKALVVKSRRALGVSAFLFALMHALLEFFKIFGGFINLQYLHGKYLLAFLLGFTALLILAAMTATSFNYVVKKMGKYWKILHRFIYFAGSLIVIHVLIIGADFANFFELESLMYLVALMFLLILEAFRVDAWFVRKCPNLRPKFIFSILTVLIFLSSVALYYFKTH